MGCPRLAIDDVIGIAVLRAIVSNSAAAAFGTGAADVHRQQSSPTLVLRRRQP